MATRLIAAIAPLVLLGAAGTPAMHLHSPAFEHTTRMPAQYTCDGKDVSPPLEWGPLPPGTKSIAVIAQDPTVEGENFVHWVLYDLPPSTRSLPAGVPRTEALRSGARQGRNDYGTIGYRGPCPSPGKGHEYWFRVYALDARLHLPRRPNGRDLMRALPDHTLRVAETMGSYSR